MSRILSSLVFVFLTLAFVSLSAGESPPAGLDLSRQAPPGAALVPGHSGIPVIRTAQRSPKKKTRKRTPSRKTEPAEPAPEPEAPAAAKEAGLKFSRDIAPVFVANCLRCHNERAMAKNGKLNLSTFTAIQQGGKDGAIIVAGKPEESHLYLRLTGDEEPRMPRQVGVDRPLSEATIEKIGQWIKEGGRLDAGLDPKAPIASYAATPEQLKAAEMARLPVAERDKLVENAGRDRWKKANAKEAPEVTPDKNFMLFGLLPKPRVTSTLKAVEAQYGRMRSLVAAPAGDPAEKIGLYVFNDRSSFVEFVRSMEKRDVDSTENGTSDLSIAEPYVAVVDPLGGREEPASAARRPSRTRKRDDDSGPERTLAGLIADYLASGVARNVGKKTPLWLSMGLGSYFAAQTDPRSPHTQRQRRAALEEFRLGWNGRALEAFGGEGKSESIRAVGFGILEAMATVPQTRPYFPVFVRRLLADSEKLDDVLGNVFGMTREQFLAGTGEFIVTHYGRSR